MAESLKKNSTLKNLNLQYNQISDGGEKAWCLVRMACKKGHRGRIKTEPLESEVSEMLKGSAKNVFLVTCKTRTKKISTTGGGTPKRRHLESHTKSKLPLSDLDNFECVLSNRLTEHISGTYADEW